jgi:hypothetical protein
MFDLSLTACASYFTYRFTDRLTERIVYSKFIPPHTNFDLCPKFLGSTLVFLLGEAGMLPIVRIGRGLCGSAPIDFNNEREREDINLL